MAGTIWGWDFHGFNVYSWCPSWYQANKYCMLSKLGRPQADSSAM